MSFNYINLVTLSRFFFCVEPKLQLLLMADKIVTIWTDVYLSKYYDDIFFFSQLVFLLLFYFVNCFFQIIVSNSTFVCRVNGSQDHFFLLEKNKPHFIPAATLQFCF